MILLKLIGYMTEQSLTIWQTLPEQDATEYIQTTTH